MLLDMKKLNFAQQALIHSLKDYAYGEHGETYPDIQAHPFENAGEAYFNDKDFILEAVKIDEFSFEFASERLKNNKTIVMAAIKKSAEAGDLRHLDFISETLKKDKVFLKKANHLSKKIYEKKWKK
jgi:hypothetical protein